jgi:hypothetical protein
MTTVGSTRRVILGTCAASWSNPSATISLCSCLPAICWTLPIARPKRSSLVLLPGRSGYLLSVYHNRQRVFWRLQGVTYGEEWVRSNKILLVNLATTRARPLLKAHLTYTGYVAIPANSDVVKCEMYTLRYISPELMIACHEGLTG